VLVASSKVRRSNARNANHAQNQVEISSPVFLLPFPFLLPSSYANVRFNVADNSAGPLSRGKTGNPNDNHVEPNIVVWLHHGRALRRRRADNDNDKLRPTLFVAATLLGPLPW
jgi:hypothetical protein